MQTTEPLSPATKKENPDSTDTIKNKLTSLTWNKQHKQNKQHKKNKQDKNMKLNK